MARSFLSHLVQVELNISSVRISIKPATVQFHRNYNIFCYSLHFLFEQYFPFPSLIEFCIILVDGFSLPFIALKKMF